MRRRRFRFTGATVGIIISAILLTAALGICICVKNYVIPEPMLLDWEIDRSKEARSFAAENEELLLKAMASFHTQEKETFDTFFSETLVNDIYYEEFNDGVQLWTFELDSTRGSALGGNYHSLFYCKTNPRDKIFDWFGDRTGMWEETGIVQIYRHNGNEIYLEKLDNHFWYGNCLC